jgi:hypothetical protein
MSSFISNVSESVEVTNKQHNKALHPTAYSPAFRSFLAPASGGG